MVCPRQVSLRSAGLCGRERERAVPWLPTGSGAEAIGMAADASPDLVVLDLGLPDVPGETVPVSCGPQRRCRS
jgi:CheY-like chemotaxis protein